MQVLIPMSGQGTRFQRAGYTEPKPLVRVGGVPMIERLLESIPQDWPCTFVIAENHKSTELESVLRRLRPSARLLCVPQNNTGPWLAIKTALPLMDSSQPVLVSYCDYGMKWNAADFKKFVSDTRCDACLISYRGFHAHYLSPLTYAYSRLEGELVKEVREKGSFTDHRESEFASCGAYYFKTISDLQAALEYQKNHNLSVNGEFYTSLTVEALLRMKPESQARVYEMDEFYQWGTPEDLKNFEYWETTCRNDQRLPKLRTSAECSQILMPMAGLGSRMSADFSQAKPLIAVEGQPMYRKALASFPQPQHTVFVTLPEIAKALTHELNEQTVIVPSTPAGQALTTEAGLPALHETDCIVTACDHGIVLAAEKWQRFIARPDCDAAIFTITGFPGSRRKPLSFSYVRIEKSSDPFARVQKVGLKSPFTQDPSSEPLLTGSFWFQSKSLLNQSIQWLKESHSSLQGELYLDSVFDILISRGFTVRQIPLDGYINWGDPESYKEAQYWRRIFKDMP